MKIQRYLNGNEIELSQLTSKVFVNSFIDDAIFNINSRLKTNSDNIELLSEAFNVAATKTTKQDDWKKHG